MLPTIIDFEEHEQDSSLVFVLVPDGSCHAQWGPIVDGYPEIGGDWLLVDSLDHPDFDFQEETPAQWREWVHRKRRAIRVETTCNVCGEAVPSTVQPEDDAPPVYHREDGSHGYLWDLQVKGCFAVAPEGQEAPF